MSNELNVFTAPENSMAKPVGATTAMMVSRQAQEVQAAMVVAKKFPRDNVESANRILAACSRRTLAEASMYEYPRGGETVSGPSIRLAEAIAQAWGNIDFGFIELDSNTKESQVMAYAWDLETNTRQTKIFSVPHSRYTRKKGNTALEDPRDIYELVANQAARRIRSCILGIIPGDVVEMAVKQCETTLASGGGSLPDRIKTMVASFGEFEISPDELSGYIGKKVEAFTVQDVIKLGKIYRSIKDGVVGCDYFIKKMKESVQPAMEPAPVEALAPALSFHDAIVQAAADSVAARIQPAPDAEPEALSLDDI